VFADVREPSERADPSMRWPASALRTQPRSPDIARCGRGEGVSADRRDRREVVVGGGAWRKVTVVAVVAMSGTTGTFVRSMGDGESVARRSGSVGESGGGGGDRRLASLAAISRRDSERLCSGFMAGKESETSSSLGFASFRLRYLTRTTFSWSLSLSINMTLGEFELIGEFDSGAWPRGRVKPGGRAVTACVRATADGGRILTTAEGIGLFG